MFGFRNKVETTKKAVELIGVNFTLSIAFGSAIKSSLNTDLSPYGINTDKFLELSSLGTNLLNKWLKTIDPKLLSELLLPVFLQDAGEFIISDLAHEKKENEKFFATIQKDHTNIDTIEKEFFGATSSDITAMIFKRWKLDDNLVKYIENISSLEPKEDESLNHSQVLQIISILANPIEPLSDASIEKANQLASVYKLNTRHLNKAIETMQDRILDA
jgi:HD-like signal output (HDOD) protein